MALGAGGDGDALEEGVEPLGEDGLAGTCSAGGAGVLVVVVGVGVVVVVTGVGVGVVVVGVAGVDVLTGVVDVDVGVLLELGLVFLAGEELLSVLVGEVGVDVLTLPPRMSAEAP